MYKLQPKPKECRKLPIPLELRNVLWEVLQLIELAKQDVDINLKYDDAIQIGPLCGGRIGAKARPYEFTFRPDGDEEHWWQLTLHRLDIEDIVDGRMTEVTMYCCPSCGLKFRDADGHCDCDWIPDPDFNTFAFPVAHEKLKQRGIDGLTQDSTRADVIRLLGSPTWSGGDCKDDILGYIWPWIKYQRDDCQLLFAFNKKQNKIRNITILKKDWQPGT